MLAVAGYAEPDREQQPIQFLILTSLDHPSSEKNIKHPPVCRSRIFEKNSECEPGAKSMESNDLKQIGGDVNANLVQK